MLEIEPEQSSAFTFPDANTSSLELVSVLQGKTYRKYIHTPGIMEELAPMTLRPRFCGTRITSLALSAGRGKKLPESFSASYAATVGPYPYFTYIPFNFRIYPKENLFTSSAYDNRIELFQQNILQPGVDPLESLNFVYNDFLNPYRLASTPHDLSTRPPLHISTGSMDDSGEIEIDLSSHPVHAPVWFNCLVFDENSSRVYLFSQRIEQKAGQEDHRQDHE